MTTPSPHPTITAIGLPGWGGDPQDFDVLRHNLPPRIQLEGRTLLGPLPTDLKGKLLLGYSMGARVALHWTLNACSQPAGLVLIGATAGIDDDDARAQRAHEQSLQLETLRKEGVSRFAARWAALPIISSQHRMGPPFYDALKARRQSASIARLETEMNTFGQGTFDPCWQSLKQLRLPVFIVAGEEDDKYRRIAHRLNDHLVDGTIAVIPGAGHAPHLENASAFSEQLEQWIKSRLDRFVLEL